MDYFGWNSQLETGIEVIDTQHKEIAMYLNCVYQTSYLKMRDEERAALHELIQCVNSHHAFEEELLEAAGYPNLEEHKRTHAEIRRRLERYFSAFLGGKDISQALVADLKMWLTTHIRYDDADYVPYLQQQIAPVNRKKRFVIPFRQVFARRESHRLAS